MFCRLVSRIQRFAAGKLSITAMGLIDSEDALPLTPRLELALQDVSGSTDVNCVPLVN